MFRLFIEEYFESKGGRKKEKDKKKKRKYKIMIYVENIN